MPPRPPPTGKGRIGKPSASNFIWPGPGNGGGGAFGTSSPSTGAATGVSGGDSYSLGPFLVTINEYIGSSFVSRWTVTLNRSARKFCSITQNCSFVVSGGMVAWMSNLSVLSQAGPDI